MNHYELLQVSQNADVEVIKAAFKAIMLRLGVHPDRGGDNDLAQRVVEAWNTLSDAETRKAYDFCLECGQSGVGTSFHTPYQKRRLEEDAQAWRSGSDCRRSSARVSVSAPVELVLLDASSRRVGAELTNYSETGLRIDADVWLSTGTVVDVYRYRTQIRIGRAQIVRETILDQGRYKHSYGMRWVDVALDRIPKGFLTQVCA